MSLVSAITSIKPCDTSIPEDMVSPETIDISHVDIRLLLRQSLNLLSNLPLGGLLGFGKEQALSLYSSLASQHHFGCQQLRIDYTMQKMGGMSSTYLLFKL